MEQQAIRERQALQLLTDEQMRTFISEGFLILKTDFPQEFHRQLLTQLDYVYEKEGNPGNNLLPRIRELQLVFDSPIIKGALTSVLGPDYIMHTHRYGHLNSNPKAGNWHKDSYWGYSRMRNHKPWWAMIMYFPQDTPIEMGPTGVMPGTQYYDSRTFESDEHEWEGKASGNAGTFALIHYDIWHRSTANLSGKQRYMLKFEFMRTQAPSAPAWDCGDPKWRPPAAFSAPIAKHDALWKDTWNWLSGEIGSLTGDIKLAPGAVEMESLLEQLKDRNAGIRAEAANQLGQIAVSASSDRAPEALREALGDEFEPVRLNAAYGLAAMGEKGAVKLLDALLDEDCNVARAAAYGLSASGEPAVDGLLSLLVSEREETVKFAAFALGELGHLAGKAVPGLVRLTGHSLAAVRRTAVEALGRVQSSEHDNSIIAALTDKLQDGDYQVHFWAGLALAMKGSAAATAIPELVRALDDDNRYVRGHAAEALRRIGTPESMSILLDYLFASRWCSITNTHNEWYP